MYDAASVFDDTHDASNGSSPIIFAINVAFSSSQASLGKEGKRRKVKQVDEGRKMKKGR